MWSNILGSWGLILQLAILLGIHSSHLLFANGQRIVTDLQQILSPAGLQVDFSYNESYSGSGEMTSVPGCPKSIDGFPWVYFGLPPKTRCFLAGYRGPCPEGRILFVEKGSPHGICSCDCFQYKSLRGTFPVSPDQRYTFCAVETEQVYDNEEKLCYDLQQRGPCGPNEWLVKDRAGTTVTCVRECPSMFSGPLYYDHKSGRCVNLWTLGQENSVTEDCPQNHLFMYSQILRRCVLRKPNDFLFLG